MKQSGILELRSALHVFNGCREGFLQRFTAEELIRIYRAYRASAYMILPDMWSAEQLAAAAAFECPPGWDSDGSEYIPQEPDMLGWLKKRDGG